MSELEDVAALQASETRERVSLAIACLGRLQYLIGNPAAGDREARLAAAVRDLETALFGDEAARAEVEARRAQVIRELLAPEGGADDA